MQEASSSPQPKPPPSPSPAMQERPPLSPAPHNVTSPCSTVRSPSAGSAAKDIQNRLRLLQRTLADSIAPTYHVPSCRDAAEKKKLLAMLKSLERADKRREHNIESHRKQVFLKAADLEAKRQTDFSLSQRRKHEEHAKQLTSHRYEVNQSLKDNSQKWWSKHENSKLKLHNDVLRERSAAREQSYKREEKTLRIREQKTSEVKRREERSEGRRRAAQERVDRLVKENKQKEEQRDLERELRQIHWDKRVAAVDRDRVARMKRVETSRREAHQRNSESTAFETASDICQKRERLREARLNELDLRRREEKQEREHKNKSRAERAENHRHGNIESLKQDYDEIERRHAEKERHLAEMKQQQAREANSRKQHHEELQKSHQEGHKRAMQQRTAGIEERWERRAERCYNYFVSDETQTLINSFKGDDA